MLNRLKSFKQFFNSRISDLLIEVTAIVLSVLLALAVNNWRESQKTAAVVERVKATLTEEIDANLLEVQRAYDYHQTLVNEFRGGGRKLISIDMNKEPLNLGNINQLHETLYRKFIAMEIPVPENFKLMKISQEKFFLRFGKLVAQAKVEDNFFNIYGEGGIRLQSAGIRNLSWEIARGMQVLVHMDYEIVARWSEINRLENSHNATVSKILDRLYDGTGSVLSILEDLVYFESELLDRYGKMQQLLNQK